MRSARILATLLAVASLAGCAAHPVHPPQAVRADAHLGGTVTAFAPDGRRFASGGWEGAVRVWRAADDGAAPVDGWRAHSDSVNGLLWLDGRTLLSAGYDGRIALWRLRAGVAAGSRSHAARGVAPREAGHGRRGATGAREARTGPRLSPPASRLGPERVAARSRSQASESSWERLPGATARREHLLVGYLRPRAPLREVGF